MSQKTRKTLTLLVNLGTPEAPSASAVRRYLAEFLHDYRVVDLSRGAAIALGLHGLGLKPVDVFPLGAGEDACPPKRPD